MINFFITIYISKREIQTQLENIMAGLCFYQNSFCEFDKHFQTSFQVLYEPINQNDNMLNIVFMFHNE